MSRLAWSQLRFRSGRALALLLGMLVAVTAFSVLTAASRTSQLRTVGEVSAHFSPAYDILVRPKGTRTALEARTGTVQPNFLSGIYGGITMRQYHEIQQIPGVALAAPIAMVGYSLPTELVPVRLPAADVARPGRQLYRVSTTWVSAGGTSRIRQPASYVYLTPDRLGVTDATGATSEVLPGGSEVTVCPPPGRLTNPFGPAAQSDNWCWSKANGLGPPGDEGYRDLTAAHPGFTVNWAFPMLIAAIDPAAEAKLDGLNRAVTSGRYLQGDAGSAVEQPRGDGEAITTFPVLASERGGIGEYAVTQVQQLPAPAAPPTLNPAGMRAEAGVPGLTLDTTRSTAQAAYQLLLKAMGQAGSYPGIADYWTLGPTTYRRGIGGSLAPLGVDNPFPVWRSAIENGGVVPAPMDNADNQYRNIQDHGPTSNSFSGGVFPEPFPRLAGVFDPGKVRAFDRLSEVPLGAFAPTTAAPADAASRSALHGSDLLPSLNIGGYVSQPPQLITTLDALPALEDSAFFSGDLHAGDPISVIRVRVAGVTGPNPVSLERIKEAAQLIIARTGLDVDIVAGSSPAPTAVSLPAGAFGQPALRLTEDWVKKGVALAILTAVDKKSVALFVLILVVCALFVANSATAAVRSRRPELGVLACLGWTRPRLFGTVLGEVALIGLAAGILGGLASLPVSAALHLQVSFSRAVLAVPAALALAILAGAVPAWLAARADPAASARPPVLAVRRGHHPAGITGLAVANVLRTPGRTLVGAASLAVGVAALTLLTTVTLAFRGVLVGSLLGNAVAVQVRGVDYVAVTATVALGVFAVADVVFLNIRERAAELATIRAFGWPESTLARLVVTEGALIGTAGSAAGAVLGLAGAAAFAGQLPVLVYLAVAVAIAVGALLTAGAAVLPAQMLRRLPTAQLLAEE